MTQMVDHPSPPTQRVVEVMELLARQPESRLSLAQIVRGTGHSRATAHAVLAQLGTAGWTTRDDDGHFSLGPAFATLARRAEAAFPLRARAAEPLRTLHRHTGHAAFLAERVGDTVTITDVAGTPSVGWIRLGRQLALRPPVCREFVAWAPEAERSAWIDSAPTELRGRLKEVLAAIRDRGYVVERFTDESDRLLEILGTLRSSPVTDTLRNRLGEVLGELVTIDYLTDELGPANAVVTLAAPIFDHTGTVVASIVTCPDNRLTTDELSELASKTMAAALF